MLGGRAGLAQQLWLRVTYKSLLEDDWRQDYDQLPEMSKVIFSRHTSRAAHPSRDSCATIVEEGLADPMSSFESRRLALSRVPEWALVSV